MRVEQEKIPSAEDFLNSKEFEPDEGISFEDYHGDSISGIAVSAMEKYLNLHLKAIRYEYNQYQFFLDGYRNGSASIGEINDAHDRFIKLLENYDKT